MDNKLLATMPEPAVWQRAGDRDRITLDINAIVVRRIFAPGRAFRGAVALTGDPPGAAKIRRALDELDRVLRDVRDATCARRAPASGRLS